MSSCVFDVRDGGIEMLPGPFFGVLTASQWNGKGKFGGYPDLAIYLFNNTFLQGVRYADDPGASDFALV